MQWTGQDFEDGGRFVFDITSMVKTECYIKINNMSLFLGICSNTTLKQLANFLPGLGAPSPGVLLEMESLILG